MRRQEVPTRASSTESGANAALGGGTTGHTASTDATTIPSANVSDVGPSPCGYLPATSKARGINYLRGIGVGCNTVKKIAIDAGNASYHYPCFQTSALTCSVDGFNCKESDVNSGLDVKDVCANAQGDKAIYNTAGSP